MERGDGLHVRIDEVVANGIKRQHPVPQIVGDLLKAEIAEKQARSIRYRLSIAKLPLAKELADFDFADTPINEALARELAAGTFLEHQTSCCSPIMSMKPTSHSDVSDPEVSNLLAELSPPSEWRLIHINM
jgi:hypothetical protein